MTLRDIQEMIEELVQVHGDQVLGMDAYAVADYGDHSHTQQLVPLTTGPEIRMPHKSAYSVSGLAVSDSPEDDEDYDEEFSDTIGVSVVALR